MKTKLHNQITERRARRTRAKLFGTPERPRLSVHKSNTIISAQLIDDQNQVTLAYVTSQKTKPKGKGVGAAQAVGKALAEEAKKKKITRAIFDRGSYQFHGAVQALAESVKEHGIKI